MNIVVHILSRTRWVVIVETCSVAVSATDAGFCNELTRCVCIVMSVQPPYSRKVRDDISVHVIFFRPDTKMHMEI